MTHVYGSFQILPKAMHLKCTAAYGQIFYSQLISLKFNYMTKCEQCLGHEVTGRTWVLGPDKWQIGLYFILCLDSPSIKQEH